MTTEPVTEQEEEQVLVIPATSIPSFQGFTNNKNIITQVLSVASRDFKPRALVETDETLLQPIPYCLAFRINQGVREYLVYERGSKGGEKRLHGQLALGFGGHVNNGEMIGAAMRRELDEEFPGLAGYEYRVAGILRDNSNPVSRVHIGVVYEIQADHQASIESPDKSVLNPGWRDWWRLKYDDALFETWSQILITQHLTA